MNARIVYVLLLAVLCAQVSSCGGKEVSFAADVRPILEVACVECHNDAGEGETISGFSVASYESIMKGTDLGPVVIPGSSISSNLYRVIAGKTDPEIRMPPHHVESWAEGRGTPLGDEEIAVIATWIDQGAKNN